MKKKKMNKEQQVQNLLEELKEANNLAKQFIKINSRNYDLLLAMRARLAVLTVIHKEELSGMGFNIDRWIKDLEIDAKQLHMMEVSLKRKGV